MRRLTFLALMIMPFFATAQLVAKSLTASNGKFLGFYEYKPTNYSSTTTKYPLIIFLHGIGERGNGTTELIKVTYQGIPKNIKAGNTMTFTWNGKTETFLVLAPQCSKSDTLWYSWYIDAMVDYAKKNLRVDTNRIMLTGLSMGGGGVWMYNSASVKNASKFAGISPICGSCLMTSGYNIAKGKPAVYAFHALNDTTSVALPICTKNALDSINKYNPPNRAVATFYPNGGHNIWGRAYDTTYTYQNPTIYEWMLNQNRSLVPNKVPIARAGKDTLIQAASGKATLNGTASTDADGTLLRYIWRKISGPSYGTLSNGTKSIASLTGLRAGIYKYELEVVDSRASWAFDTIVITVNATPVAKAGSDVVVNLPVNYYTVNGSGSYDPDGTISSYKWTKIAGPSTFTIASYTSASTKIYNLVRGIYTFRLTVTDNRGGTAYDDINIIVNQPPYARAGADSTIRLPKNSTTLIGTASSDVDGTIVVYSWTRLSGPSTYTIVSPSSATTTVSNLVQGTYYFRLAVKDNRGAIGLDTVKVTVLAALASSANIEFSREDPSPASAESLRVYPTVAHQSIQVQVQSASMGITTIRVLDIRGQEVRRVLLNKEGQTLNQVINLSGLKPALYQVDVLIGNKTRLGQKIIVQ